MKKILVLITLFGLFGSQSFARTVDFCSTLNACKAASGKIQAINISGTSTTVPDFSCIGTPAVNLWNDLLELNKFGAHHGKYPVTTKQWADGANIETVIFGETSPSNGGVRSSCNYNRAKNHMWCNILLTSPLNSDLCNLIR